MLTLAPPSCGTLHLARRIVDVVPQPVLITGGVEDHRSLANLPLQAIGLELGLLLPLARVAARALGFDQLQGPAVVAPEYVIHETLAAFTGHAADFELAVARLVQRPVGFLQHREVKDLPGLSCLRGCGPISGTFLP